MSSKVSTSVVSASIATVIATGSVWGANAATQISSLPKAEVTSSGFRESVPQTYKSWTAQADAEKVCRLMTQPQWEGCLVGHYEAKTGYELTEYEYTLKVTKATKTKKATKSWKVSYSKITLPKGGIPLKATDKKARKLPATVYFKSYGLDNGSLILGSNGSSYQEG